MAQQAQHTDQTPKSRYQRVKEILDAGAGTSTASYQGKGRFWNLPLPEFLEVVIYSVRMIAPIEDSACDPETGTVTQAGATAYGAATGSVCGCGSHTADAGSTSMSGQSNTATGCNCHGAHDHGEAASGAGGQDVAGGAEGAGAEGQPHTAAEAAPPGIPSPAIAPGAATGPGELETAAGTTGMAASVTAGTYAPAEFRQPRQPGRGKRSGLIKGLRGQYPFDGTYLPPLLWGEGTNPVAEVDVQYIEQWIDDGCPGDEVHNEAAARVRARARGEPHPVSLRPTNLYRHEAGEIKPRKNAEYLSDDEIDKLRCAIQLLKSYPEEDHRSYLDWGRVHGDMCQHGWEQFLPWHRSYLYYFEQALQDISPDIYVRPYRLRANPAFVPTAGSGRSRGSAPFSPPALSLGLPMTIGATDLVVEDLSAGLEPGDLTKREALPWQADFNECSNQDVDVTYVTWAKLPPASTKLTMQVLWWPAHRPMQVYREVPQAPDQPPAYQQIDWARGIPQTHAGDLKMVTAWSGLGFVVANPGATIANGEPFYVEVEAHDDGF